MNTFSKVLLCKVIKYILKIYLIYNTSTVRIIELIIVENIVFTKAITKKGKFYYYIKMIIKEKLTGMMYVEHIVHKIVSTIKLITREEKEIRIIPLCNNSNYTIYFSSYREYEKYNLDIIHNLYYEILEYYLI